MASEELVTPTAYFLQEQYYNHFGGHTWDEYYFEHFIELKKKIAYALYGPPSREMNESDSDDIGYGDIQMETIKKIYEKIEQFKKYSCDRKRIYMSLLFTCCIPVDKKISCNSVNIIKYARLKSDKMITSPVFKIRKCIGTENSTRPPCCCYVDDLGRVYKNWRDYLKSNKMPKGVLILPKDGLYSGTGEDDEFRLNLDIVLSPASSTLNKVINVGNKVGTGIAFASSAVFATAIFAPVAAPILIGTAISSVAVGAFGTIESGSTLIDRAIHSQPISLSDSEARSCWVNIGVSGLAMLSSASGTILSSAVSRGINIGWIARSVHNGILIASVTANGVGITNGFCSLIERYCNNGETPSSLEVFQFASSILFFCHSVVNVQTASRIIENTQISQIERNRNALRNNRHRKMFDKMAGEARRRNGNVKGNAEIIRCMRKITDKDSFFANALKINRDLNRNNVKISFGDEGKALLNGVHAVNPEALSALDPSQRNAYLSNIETCRLSAPNAPTRITLKHPINGVKTTLFFTMPHCVFVCKTLFNNQFEIKPIIRELLIFGLEKSLDILIYVVQWVREILPPIVIEILKSINMSEEDIDELVLKKVIGFLGDQIKSLQSKERLEAIVDDLLDKFMSWFHRKFDEMINSKSQECCDCKCRKF